MLVGMLVAVMLQPRLKTENLLACLCRLFIEPTLIFRPLFPTLSPFFCELILFCLSALSLSLYFCFSSLVGGSWPVNAETGQQRDQPLSRKGDYGGQGGDGMMQSLGGAQNDNAVVAAFTTELPSSSSSSSPSTSTSRNPTTSTLKSRSKKSKKSKPRSKTTYAAYKSVESASSAQDLARILQVTTLVGVVVVCGG